jgi:fatty acid desaturase
MAAASIDWYRIPLDKETLRRFTQKSNLKGWLQAGSFLLIFIITTGLALYFFLKRWWAPMIAVCYLHSLFQQMIGMSAAVHELSHGTPFKSRQISEAFYHLFCFLTWNNPVHFRASHMLHHQFTAYVGRDKEVILEPVRVPYWNMNYHIDHHMYAAVPFHQLPRFHEVLKKGLPESPKSFSAGIRLVLGIKKRQKTEPGFIYVPQFPKEAAPPRFA